MPDPRALIEPQLARLRDSGVWPVVACEIEFYLHGSDNNPAMSPFWAKLVVRSEGEGIALIKCEKEKGREQHEVAIAPDSDVFKIISDAGKLKQLIGDIAAECGMQADFSARPVVDEPGNGLHIHVHLADSKGKNIFYKNDEIMSGALKNALGGLLTWLPDCMPVFAPQEASYARFIAKTNAPITISWGGNNRTVALRLPDSPHDNKRIEHRVAGTDADTGTAVAVILAGIHYGMQKMIEPGPQIYGDAAMAQYNLPRLPQSLAEALARMENSKIVAEYFNVSDLLPAG